MSKNLCRFVLPLLLTASYAFAQTGTGAIQGTVTDPSKAVIPSARIEIVHTATARKSETAANQAGFYLIPALPLGQYTIVVSAPGMQSWQGSFTLSVAQTAVIDPVLGVGSTSTQVTVAGDVTQLVTTTNATMSNVLERARIEQLPLNGRSLNSLIMTTTPGLEGGGAPRVSGLAMNAMEFTEDGAVLGNRDQQQLGSSTRPPGLDTIAEFRVETSASSAKVSAPGTAIISTRSGTNQLHGALFETARNNAVGIARRRQDFYANNKPPHLVRNEFGASGGGPVYVPKLYNGKNRTFFFFAYEGYRNMGAGTIQTSMPTMAMRDGDFSGLVDGQGRRYTLYDPWSTGSNWSRTPYPGNIIPKNLKSPMYATLMGLTPEPTLSVNPLVLPNFNGPGFNNRREYTNTSRLDHQVTDRDQVFGRFSYGRSLLGQYNNVENVPPLSDLSANGVYIGAKDLTYSLSWTHTFAPTFYSQTQLNHGLEDWTVFGSTGQNMVDRLGLPNPGNDPNIANFTRNTGFGMVYKTQEARRNVSGITTAEQNFTKVKGRHQLQFGARLRHEKINILPDRPYNFTFFNSQATALYDPTTGSNYGATPFTGHDAANFFLGISSQYYVQRNYGWYNLRQKQYHFYFQDDFKATSRLTLNLGLRYELFPMFTDKNNMLAGFDLASKTVLTGASLEEMYQRGVTTPGIVASYTDLGVKFGRPQQFGLPEKFIHSNYRDFGPRLGFAYQLAGSKRPTVMRGGWGIYNFAASTRPFSRYIQLNAPTAITKTVDFNNAALTPDGLPNYLLRNAPTIVAGKNSRDVLSSDASNILSPGSFPEWFFSSNLPTSRAQEWNFQIEREIMDNTIVRLGYIGNHGYNLDQWWQHNEGPVSDYVWFTSTGLPIPTGKFAATARRGYDQTTYGSVNEYKKSGWSNTTSATVQLEHRYSRGYAFQLFYVMSNTSIVGGNAEGSDFLLPANAYLAGTVPLDNQERNRFLNYRRDTGIPKHRVRWNWIVDLPFGSGKKFAGNAGGVLNRIIGGWQLAGSGTLQSRYFSLPTNNWGSLGNLEVYGTKYLIQDCRSGTCFDGYLYYNGYIPANRINSYDAAGKPNGVMGVPSNYKPIAQPVFPTPANGGAGDPNARFFETNTVFVPLKTGTLQQTTLNNGLHPWRNQFVLGPSIWNLDSSLFKRVPITERVSARINADFFNVLNRPAMGVPGGDGLISLRNSGQAARELQLTLRLTW